MWFLIPNLKVSKVKITRSKNSTKEYCFIGNSNQIEFDLKNISEYYEHLTADLV